MRIKTVREESGGYRNHLEGFDGFPEPWVVFISWQFQDEWRSMPLSKWYVRIPWVVQGRNGWKYCLGPLAPYFFAQGWIWDAIIAVARWMYRHDMLSLDAGEVFPWYGIITRFHLPRKKS